ncbi:MAG TPA: universal stress protein [Gaiellaceae bacterium]|nr:universal stress protein [Gaiellaceae bacterium]
MARLTDLRPSRTVVAGYDGSDAARRALIRGAEAAGSHGRVVVVTAVQPPDTLAPHDDEIASSPADPKRLIAEARELLREHDLDVSTHIADGDPADVLATTAAETDAALIVVGARGNSYPARALRGSVGERLVARAGCDLLVAR